MQRKDMTCGYREGTGRPQDGLLVHGQVASDGHARQVGLEEQKGLGVGVVVLEGAVGEGDVRR